MSSGQGPKARGGSPCTCTALSAPTHPADVVLNASPVSSTSFHENLLSEYRFSKFTPVRRRLPELRRRRAPSPARSNFIFFYFIFW